jgi:hypothetical protein
MRLPAALALLCTLLTVAVAPSAAYEYRLGPLIIGNPHAISLIPGRPVVVYMTVVNQSDQVDRIVSVYTRRAQKAELHQHVMSGDVMMMKEVNEIDVPPQGKAELKPGGFHIMLFGVATALKPGDRIPMEIEFEFAGRAKFEAVVTKPGGADMDMSGHAMEGQAQ